MSDVLLGVTIPKLDQILDRLSAIEVKQIAQAGQLAALNSLLTIQGSQIMALSDQLDTLQATITDEVTEIKAIITSLRDAVAANAEAQRQLDAAEGRLDGLTSLVENISDEASAEEPPPA